MLAVGVPPLAKKKRKRSTDSPASTPPVVKKSKLLPATSSGKKKKKKKICETDNSVPLPANVPELILCADQLINDVKPDTEVKPDIEVKPDNDVKSEVTHTSVKNEVKNEVDVVAEHVTKVEISDPSYVTTKALPTNLTTTPVTTPVPTPIIKSEPLSPVKRKKKKAKIKVQIKEEIIEPESSQSVSQPIKKKKKKKKDIIEPIKEYMPTSSEIISETVSKKVKKKKKRSEVIIPVIKEEPMDEAGEETTLELHAEDLLSETEIKDEKCALINIDEIKDEKPDLSLFNSDIKQELLVEDQIDQQLVRNLSYEEGDPCIHHQTTNIHMALPPVYAGRIREGIEAQMKQHSLKYMKELKGVLLNYSNLSLLTPTARYLSTRPEFHFDINCHTTAFKPKIDQTLSGTVVKTGPGYVNCLVYGYFTAVVYGRFERVMEQGALIKFKLKHFTQTSSDDLVLKGVPEVALSS